MIPRERVAAIAAEVSKFCTAGASAFVVDLAVFNVGLMAGWGPITAKTLAVCVATGWSYLANRSWVFAQRGAVRDEAGVAREVGTFVVLNAVGLVLALLPLGFTYYLLGWHSALAQNISANGVGLVLGMVFRYWAYRRWVFPVPPVEIEDNDERVPARVG